jgi:hypothetical protein
MSVAEFTSLFKSQVFKNWLTSVEKNIIQNSAKSLRSSQEVASKTDFLLTSDTLKQMYETLSGSKASSSDINLMLREVAGIVGGGSDQAKVGKIISVGGKPAAFFENVNFGTITTLINRVLDTPEIENNLHELSLAAQDKAKAALKATGKKITREQFKAADNIKLTIGDFFDKGHVVGLATNLSKDLLSEIKKTEALSNRAKDQLIEIFDQYIAKLERDDLASANLPDEIESGVYASYRKSSSKYLVEFQLASTNRAAGNEASKPLAELRKLLLDSDKISLEDLIKGSSALGGKLVVTKGSPSYIDLLVNDIVNTIEGKPKSKIVYTIPKTKVLSSKIKVVKPKSNKPTIAAVKRLRNTLKQKVKTPPLFIEQQVAPTAGLEALLRSRLALQIEQNMGKGSARNVLNYRSGRFAESATIERITTSRAGMVSVFYNYMRNPYGTFSEGGAQQSPKTRDPKLLISKSIREIGAALVGNRLRAVLV